MAGMPSRFTACRCYLRTEALPSASALRVYFISELHLLASFFAVEIGSLFAQREP